MRSFAKKLACVLASAAMVITMFPAAKAQAADEVVFTLNATSKILYANEREDATYNKKVFDFNFKKAPKNYLKDYTFEWATDEPDVVDVKPNGGGIVTAKKSGVAKVTCTVTSKADKTKVYKVEAKVTVRENAAKVIISNEATYDGTVVAVGNIVDLNRTMITADGRKTSGKRTTTSAVTDRTMWVAEDSNGNSTVDKTLKGINVTQSNGKFEFTADAEAGAYKLYCYTYQSDKHPEKVAVATPVVVEFNKDVVVDTNQTTVKQVEVLFDSVISNLESIKKEDITIERVDTKADGSEFLYPMTIEKITPDKVTGKKLTVDFYLEFKDKATYRVTIKGVDFKPYEFVASNGVADHFVLSTDASNINARTAVVNQQQTLYVTVYDANNVVIYPQKYSIYLQAETITGDYFVNTTGKQGRIQFTKAGVIATVKAEYHSGEYVNNVETPVLSDTFTFNSIEDTQGIASVVSKSVKNGVAGTMQVPLGTTNAQLILKVKSDKVSWHGGIEIGTYKKNVVLVDPYNASVVYDFAITVEETSQDILAIDKDTGIIYPFQKGVAILVINMVTKDANGQYTVMSPIDTVAIEVVDARTLTTASAKTTDLLLGNTPTSCSGSIEFEGLDQYKAGVGNIYLDLASLKGLNDAARAALGENVFKDASNNAYGIGRAVKIREWDEVKATKAKTDDTLEEKWVKNVVADIAAATADGWTITTTTKHVIGKHIDAEFTAEQIRAICGDAQSAQLLFSVDVKSGYKSIPVTFQIRLQESDANNNVAQLEVMYGTPFMSGNVARFNTPNDGNSNTENAKAAIINAYLVNSGIKDKNLAIEPAIGSTFVKGNYYVKVLKDGTDITSRGQITVTGSSITINYSKVETVTHPIAGVSGSAIKVVKGDTGNGAYSVLLYVGGDNNALEGPVYALQGAVQWDEGSYGAVTRKVQGLNGVAHSQAAIANCFQIVDRNGNNQEVKNLKYWIDYEPGAKDYVFVKAIYIYEQLPDGRTYVEYVKNVGVSLNK